MSTSLAPPTEFLSLVEQELDALLGADGGRLLAAVRDLCLAPGAKRIRPRLVQLLGQAVGAGQDGLVDVAVAAELIHSGSLLHDDVVDQGSVRRGQPTANARWDNLTGVLAGDLCLTLAFVQIQRRPRVISNEAIETIATMTRAAMAEAEMRGRLDISEDGWRAMVEGKTGALFAWCGRGAARLAEADEAVGRFTRFGLHLGVAFQLADDVLDLIGGSLKDRYSDIRNREPSYPVLRAATSSSELRQRIERAWALPKVPRDEVPALGEAVLNSPAVGQTADRVHLEVEAAIAELGPYADAPSCAELAWWARTLARRARGG